MKTQTLSRLLLLSLLLLASGSAWAKGRLGFGVSVATDGYLSSTIAELKVSSVNPGSPAEKAGLLKGDIITQLNGNRVQGTSGIQLRDILSNVKPGEHVKLAVLRPDGKTALVDIIAGA